MKGRVLTAGAVLVLVAGGGVAVTAALRDGDDGAAPASQVLPKATGKVVRGDLADTETVDGTLGYGDPEPLPGGASGTVTWLPDVGATVARGKTLYGLNGAPVTLMYGETPIYRPLSPGVSGGADVRQLERNLAALGYGAGLTVDDEFTTATADAVRAWQEDRDLPATGVVDGGQVVFAPGAVRITERKVARGGRAQAGAPVFTVTGTARQVRVDLDTADQQLARAGAKVRIELPGGDTVTGKISEVGTVAQAENAGSQSEAQQSTESTIKVDITLDDPKGAGSLDAAPVSVRMASERRTDVLSVPVEALLALREGGYGVQVVAGGSVRVVPVRPGLDEGAAVGVPSR
jgi:peptidoglycan hydrolase-like protein with peptidoglycan-binding domain